MIVFAEARPSMLSSVAEMNQGAGLPNYTVPLSG